MCWEIGWRVEPILVWHDQAALESNCRIQVVVKDIVQTVALLATTVSTCIQLSNLFSTKEKWTERKWNGAALVQRHKQSALNGWKIWVKNFNADMTSELSVANNEHYNSCLKENWGYCFWSCWRTVEKKWNPHPPYHSFPCAHFDQKAKSLSVQQRRGRSATWAWLIGNPSRREYLPPYFTIQYCWTNHNLFMLASVYSTSILKSSGSTMQMSEYPRKESRNVHALQLFLFLFHI